MLVRVGQLVNKAADTTQWLYDEGVLTVDYTQMAEASLYRKWFWVEQLRRSV